MKIDLHPEHLIDLERSGSLDPHSAAQLAQHRRECAACAFEEAARADAASPPDAGDREVAQRAIAALFDSPEVAPSRRAPQRSWGSPYAALAVGAVLLAAASAAAAVVFSGAFSPPTSTRPTSPGPTPTRPNSAPATSTPPTEREENPPPQTGVSTGPPATGGRESPSAVAPSAVEPPGVEPLPADASNAGPSSAEPSSAEPSSAGLSSAGLSSAGLSSAGLSRAEPSNAEPSNAAPASASQIFARANRARRAGRHPEAARLYRQLQRHHRGSRPEVTSRVTLGYLLLRRLGQPASALPLFDSYLAAEARGPMAEEARVGRALALERLGRRGEERRAWQALLEEHPGTLHAERARRRLQAPAP